MAIGAVSGGRDVVAWTDPTVMVMAEVQQAVDEQREASHQAQRAAQETQAQASAREVAELHRKADFDMVEGVLAGVSDVAGGACRIGAGAAQAASAARGTPTDTAGAESTADSDAAPATDASAASARPPAADHTARDWEAVDGGIRGGVQIVRGLVKGEAEHAEARARSAREASEVARQMADEHRDQAQTAGRQEDKVLDLMGQVLEERRRAEQAALRA